MKKRATQGEMLTLLLSSFLSISLIRLPTVKASPITTLSVSPTNIVDPTLEPDSIFRINITVTDVQNLWGYEFLLSYNTSILTATNVGIYLPFQSILGRIINDMEGNVALAAYTYMGDREGLTTTDPTPIAWIEFSVDDVGTSVLDLRGTHGREHSELYIIFVGDVPHEDVDGFFDNRISVVMATLNIDPDTLNLRSEGQWITAYIQFPEDYNPEDIDATTILLNETVQPVLDPKYDFVTNSSEYLVDHNNDGILECMVKFNRTAVESYIYNPQGIRYGNVALTITGTLYDGIPFEGTDIIFVNYAGDANNDGIISIADSGIVSDNWHPNYSPNADFNKDRMVTIADARILSDNFGQNTP